MKVSKKLIRPKPTFEPYSITITVENPDEDYAIKYLAGSQYSVPDILFSDDEDSFFILQNLINNLFKVTK